jgi:ArsR family transcriptional regulator, arsenate/arsenite/antimonite-responsive transcriptional repressor
MYASDAIFVNANIVAADRRLILLEHVFKALADRTRLRILALLRAGEICVCHIHDSLDLPQPTVSRHLAYLRRAGLVTTRKDGLWVYYRLAPVPDPVMQITMETVSRALGHVESSRRDRKRLRTRANSALVGHARTTSC